MIRLLHVDDDFLDHELFEARLKKGIKDIRLEWADSPDTAIEKLSKSTYDCIVSDYQMPRKDGLEFLKLLRTCNYRIPFIFYTGYGDEKIASEAFRAGADDYYSKNGGFAHCERLIHSISSHVDRSRRFELLGNRELEKRLAQLDLAFKIAKVATLEMYPHKGYQIVDQNWGEMFGIPLEELPVISLEQARRMIHPDDYERIEAAMSDLLTGKKQILNEEMRATHRNGHMLNILARGKVIDWDLNGNPVRVLGTNADITHHKHIEKELREQKQFLDTILNSLEDAVLVLNNDLTVKYVNNAAKKMIDTGGNLIGELCPACIDGPLNGTNLCSCKRALDTTIAEHDNIQCLKGGTLKFLQRSSFPTSLDDELNGVVCILKDATFTRNALKNLVYSKENLASLINTVDEGIGIIDFNLNIIQCNLNAASIFDTTYEELTGSNLRKFLEAGEKAKVEKFFRKKQSEPKSYQLSINSEKGVKKDLLIKTFFFRDTDSDQQLLLGVFSETSQEEFAANTDQNDNKYLQDFIPMVSHDLRAPLRQIRGFGDILYKKLLTLGLDNENLFLLENLTDSVKQAENVIENVFKLCCTNPSRPEPEKLDITQMVRDIFKVQRQKYKHPDSTIEIAENMIATGDRSLIHQALDNIISNALKYSIFNTAPEIKVTELDSTLDGEKVFKISDNGEGFNKKHADHIFEPYVRLKTTNQYEGSGIGLAIVKRIITRHGGRIWAESEKGSGTQIYFSLPFHATR